MPPIDALVGVQAGGDGLGLVGVVVEIDAHADPVPISPGRGFAVPDIAQRFDDHDGVACSVGDIREPGAGIDAEHALGGAGFVAVITTPRRNAADAELVVCVGASESVGAAVAPDLVIDAATGIALDSVIGGTQELGNDLGDDVIIIALGRADERTAVSDEVSGGDVVIESLGEVALFNEREHHHPTAMVENARSDAAAGVARAAVGSGVGKEAVGAVIVVQRQPDLLEVVLALRAASGLARHLHRWQQQRDQHGNDRDHH